MPLFEKKDITNNLDFWYWAPDNNPTDTTSPAALYSFSIPNNPSISSLPHSPAASDVVHPRSISFPLFGLPSGIGIVFNVFEDNGDLHFTTAFKPFLPLEFIPLLFSSGALDFTASKLTDLSFSGPVIKNHLQTFVLSDSAHDLSIDDLHPTANSAAPYAPKATPDTVTTPEDVPIKIDVSALATDLNRGAILTIDKIGTGVQGPQYGTVTIAPDGHSVVYTPSTLDHLVDGILTGNQDAFQVSVKDNFGGEVTSFVTVDARAAADQPSVNVQVLTPHNGDPINEVRLLITSHSGDHGTVNQGSDYLSDILLNLTGDVTAGATVIGDTGHLVAVNSPIDSNHPLDLSTNNNDSFLDEIDLLMPTGTSLKDTLAVTGTTAETEPNVPTASTTYDQAIGIKFQHNDETPQFQTVPNDSIWNTGTQFSASKDLFVGADIPLDKSISALGITFSSSGDFKAGLTDTFNVHGGTITAQLPFDVTVDNTYNTTTDTLLIHTSDAVLPGASFTTTGPGGNFTLGAIFQLNDTLALSGGLIDTLGLGFSYPFNVESSAASLIPGDTTGGGSITDSDTTTIKIPVGPDPLAPIGFIDVAWPRLSTTSTTQTGDTITGDAVSNNFIQFNLDLLRWAAAVDPVVFGPIQGVLGPAHNDPNSFAIMQAFANVGANLLQHFALQVNHLDGILTFADGSTQSFVLGQDITIHNASKLVGSDGKVHFGLSLTPDATLENNTSVGVNVGADLYLLNNLPSAVNDILGTPYHLTGSTGVFSIPIADNGPFALAFANHTYDFGV